MIYLLALNDIFVSTAVVFNKLLNDIFVSTAVFFNKLLNDIFVSTAVVFVNIITSRLSELLIISLFYNRDQLNKLQRQKEKLEEKIMDLYRQNDNSSKNK